MKYFDVKILYRVNDNSPFVSVMYFYVKQDMQQEIFFRTAIDSILNVTFQYEARLKASFQSKCKYAVSISCNTICLCGDVTVEKDILNDYILMIKYNNDMHR